MNTQTNKPSDLARSLSHFAKCVGGLVAFYFAPIIASNFRGEAYGYLANAFGYQVAHWGSWGFVALAVAGIFFGCAALWHLLLHALIRLAARKAMF